MLKNKPFAGLVVGLFLAFFLTLWLLHRTPPQQTAAMCIMPAVYYPERDLQAEREAQTKELLVKWIRSNSVKPVSDELATLIVNETFRQAEHRRIDPYLMLALIGVESGFNHKARSSAGALGLTQVIPEWHTDKVKRPQQLFEVRQSIRVGYAVLGEYLAWHKGNVNKALLQYNGSLGAPTGYNRKVLRTKANIERYVERRLVV